MKSAFLQIKSGESSVTQAADNELDREDLQDLDVMYVLGMYPYRQPMPPRSDQIKAAIEIHFWAQQKANNYEFPLVIPTLYHSDEIWLECSLLFKKGQVSDLFTKPGDMNAHVAADTMAIFKPQIFVDYILANIFDLSNPITSCIIHMNSDVQGDPSTTNADLELLRQLLDLLEPIITAKFPIPFTKLVLSCTGTAALLRLQHGKVYAYGIWGCRTTKLEVFDITITPDQTLILRQNHLYLVKGAHSHFHKDRVPQLLRSLSLRGSRIPSNSKLLSSELTSSILPPLSIEDLKEATIYLISLRKTGRPQEDQQYERYWIKKLDPLFKPRYDGEVVTWIIGDLEKGSLPFLVQILGQWSPVLNGPIGKCQMYMTGTPKLITDTLAAFLQASEPSATFMLPHRNVRNCEATGSGTVHRRGRAQSEPHKPPSS